MAVKKGATNTQARTEVTQVNMKNVPVDLLEKVQTIASVEGLAFSEVYIVAFQKFVELYEKKNGKIKPRPKGKGLEGL